MQATRGGSTFTFALQLLDNPRLSVMVNVTRVVPIGYGPGGACVAGDALPSGSMARNAIEAVPKQSAPAKTVTSSHLTIGGRFGTGTHPPGPLITIACWPLFVKEVQFFANAPPTGPT